MIIMPVIIILIKNKKGINTPYRHAQIHKTLRSANEGHVTCQLCAMLSSFSCDSFLPAGLRYATEKILKPIASKNGLKRLSL
ncbi:hypothetical protein D3C80_1918080 [compost metagenome]|jgi:hypothetical protein